MSEDEKDQKKTPEPSDEGTEGDDKDQKETPELSDEGREKVDDMQKAYDDDRPTAVLPGTDNTITGVAINEWLDDDGNPKFGKDEQKSKDEPQEDKDKQQEPAG
ncbi:hypothetical protein [Mycobacterium sp.]|uniref:hypothetical protein n=1 Tax=Mycobacterium sp. TaxID=1785 RepID=UPI003BB0843C